MTRAEQVRKIACDSVSEVRASYVSEGKLTQEEVEAAVRNAQDLMVAAENTARAGKFKLLLSRYGWSDDPEVAKKRRHAWELTVYELEREGFRVVDESTEFFHTTYLAW